MQDILMQWISVKGNSTLSGWWGLQRLNDEVYILAFT